MTDSKRNKLAIRRETAIGLGSYLVALGAGPLLGAGVAVVFVLIGTVLLLLSAASTEWVQGRIPSLGNLPLVAHKGYETSKPQPTRPLTWGDLRNTRVPVDPDAEALREQVEDELVAIIDEGNNLVANIFTEPGWDQYVYWNASASAFVETVFGPHEAERVTRDKEAASRRQLVEVRIAALQRLLDGKESWGELRVDRAALDAAIEKRRSAPKDAMASIQAKVQAPDLAFGRAVIPARSQPIVLRVGNGPPRQFTGRVIRVPVTNTQGAGQARQVHARLLFMPDDVHRTFAPKYPAQGEWFSEAGPEIEIDLAGNGRPRLLDVALILDGEYPNVFEWTTHSRAAGLNGYENKSNQVDVEIEILGSGTTPRLRETLRIECTPKSMISADWLGPSRDPDQGDNWVGWD